jgi:methionyl-tRNA formyltransferase
MDETFDTGDIIAQYEFPHNGMTADRVYEHCRQAGKKLLEDHYSKIVNGTAKRKKQDLKQRVYYKADDVDFSKRNFCKIKDDEADSFIRAMHFDGKQYPTITINEVVYELRRP